MFKSLSIKILLVAVLCCGTYAGVIDKLSELNPFSAYKPVESEDLETTTELLEKAGYECEEHTVTTPDGYILTIHRIPFGINEQKSSLKEQSNRPAVLLQNGGFASSAVWVLNAPENCLPCALADAGFDVWLGNQRGNVYGRKHITLSPMMSRFWNFSMDEVANVDIPAIVNHIVECKDDETSGMTYEEHQKQYQHGKQQPSEDVLKSITEKFKPKIKGTWMEQMIPKSGGLRQQEKRGEKIEAEEEEVEGDVNVSPYLSSKKGQEESRPENVEWIYGGAPVREWYTSDRDIDTMINRPFVGTPETVHRIRPEVVGGQISPAGEGMLPESVSHRFKSSWKEVTRTRENSIFLIGFGQGAFASLMGLSKCPELASKVKLLIAYGILNNKSLMKVPFYRLIKNADVNDIFDKDMVLSSVEDRHQIFKNVCDKRQDLIKVMYEEPDDFFYFMGGLSRYVNRRRIPEFLPYILSGTSKNLLIHISQMLKNQRLQCFDESEESTGLSSIFNINKLLPTGLTKTDILQRYQPIKTLPEEYKLENIQVPVAIISGDIDPTTPTPDHLKLIASRVPNLVKHEVILNYGIFDFLFADNLRSTVVDKVIELLQD